MEDEVHRSDLSFSERRRGASITRTRRNIDAISLGISRNCASSRVYGLVSDALRCNDNKRDGRRETGTPDRFGGCETTFSPRKTTKFYWPRRKRPDLPLFAGIRDFILDAEGRRLSSLNIKDNRSREKKTTSKGHVARAKENSRKCQNVHFQFSFYFYDFDM